MCSYSAAECFKTGVLFLILCVHMHMKVVFTGMRGVVFVEIYNSFLTNTHACLIYMHLYVCALSWQHAFCGMHIHEA